MSVSTNLSLLRAIHILNFHNETVFFQLGFTPFKAEQPLRRMELQEKSQSASNPPCLEFS